MYLLFALSLSLPVLLLSSYVSRPRSPLLSAARLFTSSICDNLYHLSLSLSLSLFLFLSLSLSLFRSLCSFFTMHFPLKQNNRLFFTHFPPLLLYGFGMGRTMWPCGVRESNRRPRQLGVEMCSSAQPPEPEWASLLPSASRARWLHAIVRT